MYLFIERAIRNSLLESHKQKEKRRRTETAHQNQTLAKPFPISVRIVSIREFPLMNYLSGFI